MPYPSQVNRESIVQAASTLIETHSAEGVSLNAVAAALGVKAPSLYRYFDNKMALLRAVNQSTVQHLNQAMIDAVSDQDAPQTRLINMFQSYRAFAKAHPSLYSLAYVIQSPELRIGETEAERLGVDMQRIVAEVVGEARSLPVLRAAWAMAHGFIALELAGLFEREGGGKLDEAFDEAVALFVQGVTAPSLPDNHPTP